MTAHLTMTAYTRSITGIDQDDAKLCFFAFFYSSVLVLLLELNWAYFKNTHPVHGLLLFQAGLGMSSKGSFIWQKCWFNKSDGEKTGAKDIRSQWGGGVGGAYWGLEHFPDCTQRFYTDRNNVAPQYIKVSINVICSATEVDDFIYCDILVFHGSSELTWWQIWL